MSNQVVDIDAEQPVDMPPYARKALVYYDVNQAKVDIAVIEKLDSRPTWLLLIAISSMCGLIGFILGVLS